MPDSNVIAIFQKNWAITSADSKKPIIKTSSFGPCYVVTFVAKQWVAMAHIDDNTQIESIHAIFERFKTNSVEWKEVKVGIAGGWSKHEESFKWGRLILEKIRGYGCIEIDTKKMYSKETPSIQMLQNRNSNFKDSKNYYYSGALIDARDSRTVILTQLEDFDWDLEKKQAEQTAAFVAQYPNLTTEVPLIEVPEIYPRHCAIV